MAFSRLFTRRQSLLHPEKILEASPVAIFETDRDGQCVYVNRQWCNLTGLSREQALEGNCQRVVHPEDRSRLQEAWQAYTSGQAPFRLEYRLVRADGSVRWVLGKASTLTDDDGTVTGYTGTLSDISERKETESRHRLLEQAIDSSMGPVALAGIDGKLNYVNRAFLDYWGYRDKAEVLGRHASSFWRNPVEAELVIERLQSEGRWEGEITALHANGSHPVMRISSSLVRDTGGNPVALIGSFLDVSDIRRSEDRLNEAQRLAKVGSWELDLIANRLEWSDEIFRIFELDKNRFSPSYEAFLNAIHPDDRDQVNSAYSDSLANRTPYEVVHRLLMPDGRIKYVRETCESFFAADGTPFRSVGTVQDITELHKAELELHRHREHLEELVAERTARLTESEKKLRRAQQIARLGYWSVDLATGKMTWSDQVFDIYGKERSYQPTLEAYYRDIVHPGDVEALQREERATLASGKRHQIDHRFRHADGSIRWVHIEGLAEYDANGQPTQLSGTVQDITAQKDSEASLIAAKENAENANRAKSEFLSRMSHELRTPMNAILGFAQVLELEAISPAQQEYVHEIRQAGDHLLNLINDLLDLSRIESGRVTAVIEQVPLNELVQQAIQFVQPALQAKRLTLINRADSPGLAVLTDALRLKQILINLLSNAVKYNRPGGRILIGCQDTNAGSLRLSITDTGPGIAPEHLKRLFTPFERLDAGQGDVHGTGIGLALSKQLAELMGMTLGVNSTPGQGSTFWIELPRAQPATGRTRGTPSRDVKPQPESGDRRKILYIEDNAANLKVVEAMFRHRPNLALLSATNGEYGLELARRYKPDAILLDIHLPGLDGYGVLKALQADPETREIPVIALSADAMPIDIENGMKAGFRDYLTKPVKTEALMQALESVLQSRTIRET